MSSASCLYEGSILHLRREPRRLFRHSLVLAYLDLGEVPALLNGRLLRATPGLVRFRRRDYLGDRTTDLDHAVRDLVEGQTGRRPLGPVRVLTQLRSFGHCFNPVSFYYCLDETSGHIQAMVAEVTNTPWGERHAYVLAPSSMLTPSFAVGAAGEEWTAGRFAKAVHVSPFMGMDHVYEARAAAPGERLMVHIDSWRNGEVVFDATLALRRRELTRRTARRTTARYPFACARVLALIYGRALGLKLAGVPLHPHPGCAST